MSPPRFPQWLLGFLVRDPVAREVLLGDLEEELAAQRAAGRSAGAVARWYWRQALLSAAVWRWRAPAAQRLPSVLFLGFGQDLHLAARLLRRAPGFSAVAMLTVALGVAAATTTFSLVDGVLLKPLPYIDPERLVMVGQAGTSGIPGNTGYTTYLDWREQSRSFEHMAMIRNWGPTFTREETEQLPGLRVTWGFLATLGIAPAIGRDFAPADDHPDHRYVVILSDRLWRRRFGADPGIVGRSIELTGQPFEVVGVLPRAFDEVVFADFAITPEVLSPLGYETSQPSACRSCQHLKVLARLEAGVGPELARDDLEGIQRRLLSAYPRDYEHSRIAVVPVEEALVGAARPALLVLFGAVCCLLLIVCANVASLLLARAAQRQREVAVRSALGAGRGRLVRQLLTESVLLSVLGGGLGVALAAAGLEAVIRNAPGGLPKLEHAALDLRVLGFALLVVLASALVFGLAPALGLARTGPVALRRGSRVAGGGRETRARRLLVVANIALAFVLLVGAGLMLESVGRLLRVDPGFDGQGVLSMRLSFLGSRYEADAVTVQAMEEVVSRVEGLPGVQVAAFSGQVPMSGDYDTWGSEVEGREVRGAQDEVPLQRYGVTPGYFEALRLPLLRGRLFSESDRAGGAPVMLLGETAVATLFGTEDALGRRIRFGGEGEPWRTVVGVVGDVRHEALSAPFTPQMYVPQAQLTDRFVTLVVRTSVPPTSLTPAIRRLIAEATPGVPVFAVATLEELAQDTAGRERFTFALLGVFSLLGLLLAAVGLYGLIAFLVESQRQELGVRIALGAMRWDVARRVLQPGLLLLASGLALGWAVALGLGGLLSKLLFQVPADDPGTFAGIALLLTVASLAAHLAPLLRALAVDPTAALREE